MLKRARLARNSRLVAAGLLVDRALGEPPDAVHPIAGFGTAMGAVERVVYRDDRAAGVAYTAIGVGIGTASGAIVRSPMIAVATVAAGCELRAAAARVRDRLQVNDLAEARALLPTLVGRDPSALDPSGVAAAVIESLAENSVDAVIAPAFWGVVAGAPGAGAYRAVNTMDAMVGHTSPRYLRFGWSAARLDDVANFLPARLTALLVAVVRPRRARHVARAVFTQAGAHPSPNAGVAEAAFAGALGVELGGPLRYGERLENRPRLGVGPRPSVADIDRAIALASHVELALVAGLGMKSLALALAAERKTAKRKTAKRKKGRTP
jgi:adenosylcobinamide-phosphate synthase